MDLVYRRSILEPNVGTDWRLIPLQAELEDNIALFVLQLIAPDDISPKVYNRVEIFES